MAQPSISSAWPRRTRNGAACRLLRGPRDHPDPGTDREATPTPSPTPLPPDTLTVGVLGIGVGTFDLAAFPVARLKNEAKYHGAASVVVHFVTHRAGHTLGSLELESAVNLGPGETLAVTGDCTDACNGATSVAATVTVGLLADQRRARSSPPHRPPSPVSQCHAAHGYGNVKGTLTPSDAGVCRSGGGRLRGLPERRRGDPRRRLRAVRLAGRVHPHRGRPGRAQCRVRPPAQSEHPPAGEDAFASFERVAGTSTRCGTVAGGSDRQVVVETRVSRWAAGGRAADKPGQGSDDRSPTKQE